MFLDANTLVYHFMPHPQLGATCTALIKRIERREIEGSISTHVLTEVAHRLMTVEACDRFGWPFPGIAARLRNHPLEVRALTLYRQAVEEVPRFRRSRPENLKESCTDFPPPRH